VIGDKAILGFNRDELTKTLELSYRKEKKVADRRLFETLDRILEAVIRAVRQVPPDRLTWKTPDRDRPLKVFCYHILADPNHVLDAIFTQKYDGSFKLTYGEAAERFRDMEEVARFGEETRRRLREASERLAAEDLGGAIDGYSGETNGHELFHHVLGHTAHHLKQLYGFLNMVGVEPTDPLQEEEFEGIAMPTELW